MKILVTGANGLLGQHLVKKLLEKNHQVIATGKGECRLPFEKSDRYNYYDVDITDGPAINEFISNTKAEVIVHAAAMTQIDECELHKQECYNTNVTATRFILDAAKPFRPKFIYVSTDFVFDGLSGPYKEDDAAEPVNYYGSTKLAAEKSVMESGLGWAIVRTILVYGNTLTGTRNNIVNWVKQNLEEGKTIKVVTDQWRTPTYVEDLAKGIILVIEKNATGIYNIGGKDVLTPYDMAIKTADYFKLDKNKIEKVDASTFQQPGQRPRKTGFNIEKAKNDLGYEPLSFEEGLQLMFQKN